jgi:hypothetical protein
MLWSLLGHRGEAGVLEGGGHVARVPENAREFVSTHESRRESGVKRVCKDFRTQKKVAVTKGDRISLIFLHVW